MDNNSNNSNNNNLRKLIQETIELYDNKLSTKDYLIERGVEFHTEFGGNYTCLCPIHDEDEPSFSYSEKRDIWTCFGECHTSGRVSKLHYKLLEKERGKTNYIEVLRDLQRMFPAILPVVDFSPKKVEEVKKRSETELFNNFLKAQEEKKQKVQKKRTLTWGNIDEPKEFDLNLYLYNKFRE